MREFVNYTDSGGPAFLNSLRGAPGQVIARAVAELFTITLATGTIYRWTSYDKSLTVISNTWLAPIDGGALVTCNRLGVKNTVEVPELEFRLGCSDSLLGNLKAQIHNGLFDGATVEMDRVYMPADGDTRYGYIVLFSGRLAGVTIDAEGITITTKGHNVLMNQQAPRNLYQTNCLHTFCDPGCTLLASNYTFTGLTYIGGGDAKHLRWTVPAGFTASQFTLGKVTMTSGPASGQIRTVSLAVALDLIFTYPLYTAPNVNDTFDILMGCDRQLASCQTRKTAGGSSVDNSQHYRGFPFVPQAELAV